MFIYIILFSKLTVFQDIFSRDSAKLQGVDELPLAFIIRQQVRKNCLPAFAMSKESKSET